MLPWTVEARQKYFSGRGVAAITLRVLERSILPQMTMGPTPATA